MSQTIIYHCICLRTSEDHGVYCWLDMGCQPHIVGLVQLLKQARICRSCRLCGRWPLVRHVGAQACAFQGSLAIHSLLVG